MWSCRKWRESENRGRSMVCVRVCRNEEWKMPLFIVWVLPWQFGSVARMRWWFSTVVCDDVPFLSYHLPLLFLLPFSFYTTTMPFISHLPLSSETKRERDMRNKQGRGSTDLCGGVGCHCSTVTIVKTQIWKRRRKKMERVEDEKNKGGPRVCLNCCWCCYWGF